MKTNKCSILAAVVASLGLATAVQAVPITGNIGFTGNVVLDTGTAQTATTALSYNSFINPTGSYVSSGGGSIILLAPAGTLINFVTPWTFFPGSAVPITPFWTSISASGLTFSLSSWSATRNFSGGLWNVAITGTGIMTDSIGDGPTAYNYSVTFQDPASNPGTDTFTFSASQAPVPDGGATVMLLGAALSAFGLLRKKLTA